MLKQLLSFIDTMSEVIGKGFSFLILPVVILEAFEVVLRHGLQSPTDWSWELAAMVSGAMFVMGGAWVLKENRHVRTDIFFAKFSPKTQAIIDVVLFTIIFFPFVGLMSFMGIKKAIYSVSIQETTYSMCAPPLYPLKIIIALAFVLLVLQGLAKWIRDLHFVMKGYEL